MLFAGYSRGGKAPGLADGAAIPTNAGFVASPTVFIPEESIDTFEGGFKWQQDNGFINATAFYLDVENFQNVKQITQKDLTHTMRDNHWREVLFSKLGQNVRVEEGVLRFYLRQ